MVVPEEKMFPVGLGAKIAGGFLYLTALLSLVGCLFLLVILTFAIPSLLNSKLVEPRELAFLGLAFLALVVLFFGGRMMSVLAKVMAGDFKIRQKEGFGMILVVRLFWELSCTLAMLSSISIVLFSSQSTDAPWLAAFSFGLFWVAMSVILALFTRLVQKPETTTHIER